jgi:hypothetical protein
VISLDSIVDRVCEAARADFAFVLTRRGRLATRKAPENMPEAGRNALLAVAEKQLREKRGSVSHVDVPREMLVPFGGAAPVDVYVAAREEAILCVVMATFAEQLYVSDAIAEGTAALDKLLLAEAERRERRRPGRKEKEKPEGPRTKAGRRGSDPALEESKAAPAVVRAASAPAAASPAPEPFELDDSDDMPTITIAQTKMGRATLAAIEIDRDAPEITYSTSTIGRRTLGEIELSLLPAGDPRSSVPDIRVDVISLPAIDGAELDVTDRTTLPFTERPEDAKRRFELAERLRQGLGPVVLETTKTRTVIAGRSKPFRAVKPAPVAEPAPRAAVPTVESKPRDSNIEIWHSALAESLEEKPSDRESPRRRTQPPPRAPSSTWARPTKDKEKEKEERAASPSSTRDKSVWPSASAKPSAKRKLPPASSLPVAKQRPSDKPKR